MTKLSRLQPSPAPVVPVAASFVAIGAPDEGRDLSVLRTAVRPSIRLHGQAF